MRRVTPFALSGASALAILLANQPASGQDANVALIAKIYAAHAERFSMLKAERRTDDAAGNSRWTGTAAPFGMNCEIIQGDTNAYYCERNGMADTDAGQLYATLQSAFRTATPDLSWKDGTAATVELKEVLGASSSGQFLVSIATIRLGDGKNDGRAFFYIFPTPMAQDPLAQQ
jgi:hypothetical protein